MSHPVIKGVSYSLVHAANLLISMGTTQALERAANPDSDYLKGLPEHLRAFGEVVDYCPNQVYIGNAKPHQLKEVEKPWYVNSPPGRTRGIFGEIMEERVFYLLLKLVDAFELVMLDQVFIAEVVPELEDHPLFNLAKPIEGVLLADIETQLRLAGAQALYWEGRLVGCVKRAHDLDPNLNAHVMVENLVAKASGVLALRQLLANSNTSAATIDYIIEASEEACGDMNQRGGGNFAKAIGETAGCINATGCDIRGFCAAPAHAIVVAASLVQAGVYKNVAVVAGGSTAKLGMNGKSHVEKGMPVLEDVLGSFAVLVSFDDGKNPVLRTDVVGRHTIGKGSSPQAVIQALVTDPLGKAGLCIPDVDKYSVEMQNPEITVPAGAGDVPAANYKMIGAMAVKLGDLDRSQLADFADKHGMPGYAPTQGHIPSGVPFIGHAREQILCGELQRVMVIGKGSLFLARMTNLFDGVSFILEANPGLKTKTGVRAASRTRVVLTTLGSELGSKELVRGAEMAVSQQLDLDVVLIGPRVETHLEQIEASCEAEAHRMMDAMLSRGEVQAAVTLHYNFPLGVATVGRVITPAQGKPMLLATTTGTSSADRVQAMVLNALDGIAVAKTLGIARPRVGILNVDGARQVERILNNLGQRGYDIQFAQSVRGDGGSVLRGNDLLTASADVVVCDTLTGNLLMKMFSAFTSGGTLETQGWGYGPGIGQFDRIVNIISRASGAPVVAGALAYAAQCARGGLARYVTQEYSAARGAGLDELWEHTEKQPGTSANETKMPAKKPVTASIAGIDILELEQAVAVLWQSDIYAETGMGCAGPVIMTATEDEARAQAILQEKGYL